VNAVASGGVRRCGNCEELSAHVRTYEIDGKAIEVVRCLACDTWPCKTCEGRTLDPSAQACRHCGASIKLTEPKEGAK